MRVVSDMEGRLRASALKPPVRNRHYEALLGEIRARGRSRRRRPYVTAAAACVLVSLVFFQSPPLESFNYRFEYVEYRDDGRISFKPHEDANTSVGHSRSVDGEVVTLTPDEAEIMQRRWEVARELFMAGQLELTRVRGTTVSGETHFGLIYEGEVDGEKYRYIESFGAEDCMDLDTVIASPEHLEALHAEARGLLDSLPSASLEMDAREVRFRRTQHRHSRYGDVVLWVSEEIN